MSRLSVSYGALGVDRVDTDRAEVRTLQNPHEHIHGEVEISVDGLVLPALGYFGADDVCVNTWLEELWRAIGQLSMATESRFVFDEGEQGQPAYVFERNADQLSVSVIDGAGRGKADPEWQGVEATFTSLVEQVKAFTSSLHSTLVESAGDLGASWLHARTDPAIAHAVGLGSVIAVRALLDGGLRPNAVDNWTDTPIVETAIRNHNHELIELLASRGAGIELRQGSGMTALQNAARTCTDGDVMETLLRCGAEVAAVDNHGWTALHHAAVYGCLANVQALLAAGANATAKTSSGLVPARLAAQIGHTDTVAALVAAGDEAGP